MSTTPLEHRRQGPTRPACGLRRRDVVRRRREPRHHCGSRVTRCTSTSHEPSSPIGATASSPRPRPIASVAPSVSKYRRPSFVLRLVRRLSHARRAAPVTRVHRVRRDAQDHRTDDLTFAGRARTHGSAAHHQELPTRGPRRVWPPSAKIRDHHDPIRRTPSPATSDSTDVESVMAGEGFYSAHSQSQHVAAAVAFPYLAAAAESVPLPGAGAPVTIGDFGCAGGANEMAPMALAIDTLRKRTSAPVEIVHTDLPQNDFGSLFALLASPSGYPAGRQEIYPSAIGRTLYGPLLPERQLLIGWSGITLHWLSTVPVAVPDQIYPNLVTGPARERLRQQSADDWDLFPDRACPRARRRRRAGPRGGSVTARRPVGSRSIDAADR